MSEPVRHDYTRETYKGGWSIIGFDYVDAKTVKISAFGLKRDSVRKPLEESYLQPGEEVVITMPDGVVLYEITTIRYHRDPFDLYDAKLKYIQHLSGMPIVSQDDEKQRERQLEWSRESRERRGESE